MARTTAILKSLGRTLMESPMHPFEEETARFIRRENLFKSGDTVVVGVSGGADSSALLCALAAISADVGPEVRLVAAHLDHGLRPESAEDAEQVGKLASTLDIPFRLGRARSLAVPGGGSVEMAARKARYAFFARIARKEDARALAVAHHRDDRVETVLHRLLQGATLGGLAGIPLRRPLVGSNGSEVVRPLFERNRRSILAYVKERKIPYLKDPTNHDGSNARGRLREMILPALEEEYPHARSSILRLEQLSRDATRILDKEMNEESTRFQSEKGSVRIPRAAFDGRTEEGIRRVLQTALESLDVERSAPPLAAVKRMMDALYHRDSTQRRVPIMKMVEAVVGPVEVRVRLVDARP